MNVIIEPDIWRYSQLSIAAHYGSIRINGREYFVDDASGCLVRSDWVGVVKADGVETARSLISQGYRTASSAMAVIRKEKAEEKRRARKDNQPKLF
jgi:hypothetical protein